MTSPRVSSVHQQAGEEGWNAGERVLSRCRIRSLDPDNTGSGGKRHLAARQIGPIEMVIGAGVNLHFDLGAAGTCAVKKSVAWDPRNPDVFGADQYHERDGGRPRWLLPLLVARCRIEGYRRPKVAPRQLARPAKALRADREEKSATALRPAHYANAIGPNKRLRLQKQQR